MTDVSDRFAGIKRLYGVHANNLIRRMHVAVIGIGGVGSWAVEALARSGVGELSLVDYDGISLSNVNRQIHTLDSTVDQKKIAVMGHRVLEINPACKVHLVDDFITMESYESILNRGYDYVLDAIDSIKFKATMIGYCKRNKIPIVTTGGAGGLSDPGMIKVTDLSKTYNDPLAAKVRSRLRDEFGFSRNPKRRFGVECVFSSQQPVYPKADGTVSHEKPGIHGVSLDCRFGYGTAAYVTAAFGLMAASRVINKFVHKHTG